MKITSAGLWEISVPSASLCIKLSRGFHHLSRCSFVSVHQRNSLTLLHPSLSVHLIYSWHLSELWVTGGQMSLSSCLTNSFSLRKKTMSCFCIFQSLKENLRSSVVSLLSKNPAGSLQLSTNLTSLTSELADTYCSQPLIYSQPYYSLMGINEEEIKKVVSYLDFVCWVWWLTFMSSSCGTLSPQQILAQLLISIELFQYKSTVYILHACN